MNYIRRFWGLGVVLILSYFAITPFLNSGFFPMHDDTQVQRVFEMKKALSDGMFPVRWVADLGYGYGYPIYNFYAPLAYYVGGFVNLAGFDSILATKVMMITGILLSGLFMYLFAKQFWGEIGGIAAGLLYLYAPYHALDIYVRGDVAEFFAYAFIPLVFYGLWKVYEVRKKKFVAVTGISFACIILSHNLTALMITPFILIYALILLIMSKNTKKAIKPYFLFIGLLLGLVLAAFYWLPTLSEMNFTNVLSQVGGGADYKDHFVCLSQLWNSPWGFGGSAPGCIDGLSFKIGKLHIVLALFSLLSLGFLLKLSKTKFVVILFSMLSLVFSIFIMLDYSKFIWDGIAQMAFLQYPWRFLVVVSFFISFLSGAIFWLGQKIAGHKKGMHIVYFAVSAIAVVSLVYFNMRVFKPETIQSKIADEFTNTTQLTWFTSKISDEYMPKTFKKPNNINEIPSSKISVPGDFVRILKLTQKTQLTQAVIDTQKSTQITLNTAYFPAWHAFIDGHEIAMTAFNTGYKLQIPEGRHLLTLKYIQTPVEKFADLVSVAGVIVLLLGIIIPVNKKKYEHKKA